MNKSSSLCFLVLALCLVVCCVLGGKVGKSKEDLESSATGYGHGGGYGGGSHGQVHISVHRGPTEKHGYHYFAPFSYYVRQPEDDHGHGGYGYRR